MEREGVCGSEKGVQRKAEGEGARQGEGSLHLRAVPAGRL